jgi:hypothetical protein
MFSNLRFLSAVTLIVYLPAKLGLQLACQVLDVPTSGILSFVLLDLSGLVLGAMGPLAVEPVAAQWMTVAVLLLWSEPQN